MVIIRRDNVQIVHIVLYETIQLPLAEDMVIPVARHQSSHLVPRKTLLWRRLGQGRGAAQFCSTAGQHLFHWPLSGLHSWRTRSRMGWPRIIVFFDWILLDAFQAHTLGRSVQNFLLVGRLLQVAELRRITRVFRGRLFGFENVRFVREVCWFPLLVRFVVIRFRGIRFWWKLDECLPDVVSFVGVGEWAFRRGIVFSWIGTFVVARLAVFLSERKKIVINFFVCILKAKPVYKSNFYYDTFALKDKF